MPCRIHLVLVLSFLLVAPGFDRPATEPGLQDTRDQDILRLAHQMRLREAGGVSFGYHFLFGLGPEGAAVGFDLAVMVLVFSCSNMARPVRLFPTLSW